MPPRLPTIASVFLLILSLIDAAVLTHDTAIGQLSLHDISIRPGCTDRGYASCTSLDGIQAESIAGLIWLHSYCNNTPLTITGGTEVGPPSANFGEFWLNTSGFSHSTGWKVDLRKSNALDECIERNFDKIGEDDEKTSDYCVNGFRFRDGASHWDVNFGWKC